MCIAERNELILSHKGLVYHIVNKYSHRYDEDLIQEAYLGLIKAANLFAPETGYKFSTYAYKWISGHVLTEFKRRKKHSYNCLSLDNPITEDDSITLGDLIPDGGCIEDEVVSNEYVESAFAELSESNRDILAMIMDGKTQLEISRSMGVRPSRITERTGSIRKLLKEFLA